MNSEQIEIAIHIFDAALGLPAEERRAYLAAACTGDEELRGQVERLLQRHDEAGDFLEQPALPDLNRPAVELAGRQIGPYRLLRELGAGGMGFVYLAVRGDDVYRKAVAVKLVWPALQREAVIRRFIQERQILADLDHPNIARLLDGGMSHEDGPYLVMDYVDGVPITEYCDRHQLNVAERLKLFRTVCAAVEYAHQNQIVHRDIKPGNIFVTANGTVKLLDFGIAKLLNPDAQSIDLTLSGLPLLTPGYASPEQMMGETITTSTDIYSFGVLLYELLTGHLPYRLKKNAVPEVVQAIAEANVEPPSSAIDRIVKEDDAEGNEIIVRSPEKISAARGVTPEKLRRLLQGDLDNITLKALRREPKERYISAAQLSRDIDSHLSGRPVIAQKPTMAYRAGKFIKRHKAGTGLALILFVASIAGTIGLIQRTRNAVAEAKRNRPIEYARQMEEALQEWSNPPAGADLPRMQRLLDNWLPDRPENIGKPDLRGFEWYYLWKLLHRDQLTLQLEERPREVRAGSDNSVLLGFERGRIRLVDVATGKIVDSYEFGSGRIDNIYSYLGKLWIGVMESDHRLSIFSMRPFQRISTIVDEDSPITNSRSTDDHNTYITGHADGSLKFWDAASSTPKFLFMLKNASAPVEVIIPSPDGKHLLVWFKDNTVEMWNLVRRRLIHSSREKEDIYHAGFRDVYYMTFDGNRKLRVFDFGTMRFGPMVQLPSGHFTIIDNRFIICGGDGKIRVLSVPSGQPLTVINAHKEFIYRCRAFLDNQGNKLLETAGSDRTIKLWDLKNYEEVANIRDHPSEQQWIIIEPDEQKVIASYQGNVLKVWDVAEILKPETLKGHQDVIYSVAVSQDGKTIATASKDKTARVWDADARRNIILRGHADEVLAVAISPDSKTIATGSKDNTVKLWEAATGELLRTIDGHSKWVRAVAFSPDGRQIATGSQDRTIKLWEILTGDELSTLKGHTNEILSVAFSPDGKQLTSGSWDETARVWDLATFSEILTLKGHRGRVWSARFSPDGNRIATAGEDRLIKLWDSATGKELATLKGHTNEIFSVEFTPDGKRLASASNDYTIKIWNVETGQEVLTLRDHQDQVWSVAFSKDGKTMVSGSWDKTARIWRAATEAEVRARINSN